MRTNVLFAGNISRLEQPPHQVVSIEDWYLLACNAYHKQDGMMDSTVTTDDRTTSISFPLLTPDRLDPLFQRGSWVRLIGGTPLYYANVGCIFWHPTSDKY